MEFSIKMELAALVILAILWMYHLDRQNSNNTRYRLFTLCLTFSTATIVFDVASTLALRLGTFIPTWVDMILNTAYFIAIDMAFSLIAIYCFYIMFEHSVDKHCYLLASRIIMFFAVVLLVVNIINIWGGWIFTFEQDIYVRGPLNKIGFVPMVIECGMLCMCYFRNRSIIGSSMKRVVQTLPTLAVFVVIIQMMVPNVIMTGTLAALVCMILFINLQSSRNGRDALTGLPNRSNFTQEIMARRKRGETIHLIMVHLDRFEEINKKYGAKIGDSILFSVAGYLERKMERYQVCRFGNTTFLLMAKSAGAETDLKCVRKIKDRFNSSWVQGDRETRVHVSIAHRMADFDGYDENTAIDQLEYALTCVRENGGDGILCFDDTLKKSYERQEYVLKRVKEAIKENLFEVYFQPIYHCQDKTFRTAESLLRLKEEDGTFIPPSEFIPLAEKHGLMDEISQQVLDQVCAYLGGNADLSLNQVSVNIPAGQVLNPDLMVWIDQTCRRHNVPARKLRLEITERIMAEQPERVREVMELLAEKGVKFYLDDFGIGYSNLSMVMELPFETVKLDSSLLSKMINGTKEYRTMELLVEMLHNSGFQVVVEGIEHEYEVLAAQKLQIDRIQGFYYAKPVPGNEVGSFFDK